MCKIQPDVHINLIADEPYIYYYRVVAGGETNPSRAVTSSVLGQLPETTARVHQCSGGIKTLELLPPHLVADSAAAARKLIAKAYCDINDITAEEAVSVFDRLALSPSLAGCGLRYYRDVSPVRVHDNAAAHRASSVCVRSSPHRKPRRPPRKQTRLARVPVDGVR